MSNIQDKHAYTDGTLTLQEDVSDAIGVYARSRPEEGESWESWFGSAFDLARERVAAVFREHAARNLSTHPGQKEMLAEVRRYGVQTQLSDVTDEMAMAGYNAMRDPATNLPAPWIVLGHAGKVFGAMLGAAPKAEPMLLTGTLGNSVDLLRIAADNGLQIFCPDAEPNAVVRWYPWNDGCRVSADAGDCLSEGLPVNNYSMTFLAIRKALASRGISHSTNDTEVEAPSEDKAIGASTFEQIFAELDAAHELSGPAHERIAELIRQRERLKSALAKVPEDIEWTRVRGALATFLTGVASRNSSDSWTTRQWESFIDDQLCKSAPFNSLRQHLSTPMTWLANCDEGEFERRVDAYMAGEPSAPVVASIRVD